MLERLKKIKLNRLPVLLIKIFIVIIVITALLFSVSKMMEYSKTKGESEKLMNEITGVNESIEELRYYINAEPNEKYKEKMAKLIGYSYPEDVIYYIE